MRFALPRPARLAATAALIAASLGAQTPPPRVLLVSEYGRIPAIAIIDSVFQRELTDSVRGIRYDAELLDVTRFRDSAFTTRTLAYLGQKYATDPPGVILAAGFQGVSLADRLRRQSFPHAAIVFLGVDERLLDSLPRNAPMTGVSLRYDFAGTARAIRILQPRVTRIVVISGLGAFDLQWLPVAHREIAAEGYAVRDLVGLPLRELCDSVARLPDNTAIVFVNIFRDREGNRYTGRQAGQAISRAASVPVYSVHDIGLDAGVVGGHLTSYRAQAEIAVRITRRVLAGESPASIPVVREGAQHYQFDWRQLRRWHFSERSLPPESQIFFREPTFYERFRLEVIGVALALIAQAALIAALLAARRRQRRAQAEVERRLRLEKLVSELSSSFVEIPIEQTEAAMQHWLSRLRESFEVDRARLARFRADGSLAHVTMSAAPAVTEGSEGLDLPSQQMPELVGRLYHGGQLRVASVDRELTDYPADRELLRRLGTRSVLALPLPGKDRALGAISLGMLQRERVWTDAEVQELTLVAEVFSNVLRRQDAEAEIDRQSQVAAHASRVATLGELAASLAHELNQPLTAILSNANAARRFLEADPPDLAEVRSTLADIAADDRRASDIIARMRAMLRRGELVRRPLDLNELVADAVRLAAGDAVLKQVRIDTRLASSLPPVEGDPVQLQQVVLNLVLNGLDASADQPHPRFVTLTTARSGEEVSVSLRDRGKGIPVNALKRIFEPFYTTKDSGLGMGLSISRSIVEAHGGRIWAANNEDGGATVAFAIPVKNGSAA